MSYPDPSLTPNDPDELAALYVLDMLDTDERNRVETDIQASGDLAQVVNHYQDAITAIPYSVPPVPMATNLKDRLFQRIADESAQLSIHQSSPFLNLLDLDFADLKRQSLELAWSAMTETSVAEIAVWKTDEVRREVVFFARAKVGCPFPKHAHAAGETVLVLEGDFIVEGHRYGVGDRIYAPGNTAHQPDTENGCLLLCVSSMDDEIVP